MISNYKRGWHIDERFTVCALCLDQEQAKVLKDNITVSYVNKKQHIMVNVWTRNLFNCPVIIEWNNQTSAQKTYTHMVTFFVKQVRAIKIFKAAAGWGIKGRNLDDVCPETQGEPG